MSKGEPIKLSTSHFSFCAQSFNSSRNWLGQLLHESGQGMGVRNLNLGKHPFLGKRFLTYWASYFPKMLPIPSCIHVFLLSHVFGAVGYSPFTFLQFPVFSPWLGSCFPNIQSLGSLLGVFVVVSLITRLGKNIFGLHNELEKRPMIFGCWMNLFLPT